MHQLRRLAPAFAASLLLAPIATAQDADPLCAGLTRIHATASDELPFIALVPATQSLGSLPALKQKPAGMEDFTACQLYRAGNAKQGVNGGGPYNYVRCTAFQKSVDPSDLATKSAATEAWTKLADRTKACLTPLGWTVSGGERKRDYEDYTTEIVFTQPGSLNDIAVTLKEDNSSPGARSSSVYWAVDLYVRNPNPTHPKPG